jgi:hypothetical protein
VTKRKGTIDLGFESADVHDRTVDDVQAFARWVFLNDFVRRIKPKVLSSLAEVPCDRVLEQIEPDEPDPGALVAWAQSWQLTDDWCLAYARATYRAWRHHPTLSGRVWCPRDDESGALYQPRPGRQAPREQKDPEHFNWLVAYQVCQHPYGFIAASEHRSSDAIRDAVHRLAKLIGLTLRQAARGGARRPIRNRK